MSKRGLGKGIDAIIPKEVISAEYDPTAEKDKTLSKITEISIDKIKPNPNQPRRKFDQAALKELAESIKNYGVLQPVVLIKKGNSYELVAGERRWRASKLAGKKKIPAVVRTLDAQQQMGAALVENIQREDLNPLELASVMFKLAEQFNMTNQQIADNLGKSAAAVANTIRLLRLPEPAKRALLEGRIVEGHARQILALDDPKKQQELLDLIIRHSWTVRRAEQYVIAYKEGAKDKQGALKVVRSETPLTKKIEKKLNTKVRLQKMAKGGRLIIEYKNDDELKRIAETIG